VADELGSLAGKLSLMNEFMRDMTYSNTSVHLLQL
jgi:hypothetical protein